MHVLFSSLSDGNLLMAHKGLVLSPIGFSTDSYRAVFKNSAVLLGYRNTLIVLVAGVTLSIVLTSMGAYFASRKGLYFKKHITLLFIFTMFFSGGLIPFYLTVSSMGFMDTLFALFIPYSVSVFNMIIMRTAFEAIPDSLEESAKIDGAHDFTVLFKIILPLSMPVIAVMLLYYGVQYWNSWFPAMIFINDVKLYPLQLILRNILIDQQVASMLSGAAMSDENISVAQTVKYATIMVATVPILCVYPFLQKYFVKGVLIGAVKG